MLLLISLTVFIKKSLKIAGSWSIRYIFVKGANFSSPGSLLHMENTLFLEVAELISYK